MKVLHILGGFKFGGIEKLVYDLVKEQSASIDVTPEILVLHDSGEFSSQFHELGVKINSINPKSTYKFDLQRIKQVIKVYKSADILHFHGFHVFLGILAIFTGKKIVYTEHGNFGFGRRIKISDKMGHFLRKKFYKYFVDLVACNSEFTKNYLRKEWGLKGSNILTVYNGSNVNNKPSIEEVKKIKDSYGNKFLVGTTSRLAGFKRISRLIIAYKAFSKNKTDTTLIVVGDGPERNFLENEAGLMLNKTIFFVGFKPNPLVYQKSFDVSVFPSTHEPFGLVAVEAYSAGSPVIVFKDGGGLTEIVSRCDTEDIVGSEDELQDRLEYYYGNRNLVKNTTKVLNYFTVERMANDYLQQYKKLLCAE